METNTNTLIKAVEMKDQVHKLLHLDVDKLTFGVLKITKNVDFHLYPAKNLTVTQSISGKTLV